MADFPTSVYAPRTKENALGVIYDALKTRVGYAEDVTKLDAEVVSIETILGLNPQGASVSVGARISALDVILNKANLGAGYLMRWDGSKFVNSNIFQDANGNDGIGTTGPQGSLHIAKQAGQTSPLLRLDSSTTNYFTDITSDAAEASFKIAINGVSLIQSGNYYYGDKLSLLPAGGNVGIATTDPTAKADINSNILRLRTAKTPASAGAAGNAGDICWDASYIYVCIATNTWVRASLATW